MTRRRPTRFQTGNSFTTRRSNYRVPEVEGPPDPAVTEAEKKAYDDYYADFPDTDGDPLRGAE